MSSPITFPVAGPESLGGSSASIERYPDHVRDAHFELDSLLIFRHGKLAASGWRRVKA